MVGWDAEYGPKYTAADGQSRANSNYSYLARLAACRTYEAKGDGPADPMPKGAARDRGHVPADWRAHVRGTRADDRRRELRAGEDRLPQSPSPPAQDTHVEALRAALAAIAGHPGALRRFARGSAARSPAVPFRARYRLREGHSQAAGLSCCRRRLKLWRDPDEDVPPHLLRGAPPDGQPDHPPRSCDREAALELDPGVMR